MKHTFFSTVLLICVFGSPFTMADFALGLGATTSQEPQRGIDPEQFIIPLVSYSGERFSFQFTTINYQLTQIADVEISLVASGRLQGYEAKDSPYLLGMKDRDNTLDGGINLAWNGINLSMTSDLLNKHDGQEAALSYEKGFDFGRLMIMTSVGLAWQSQKLTQYYYGVEPHEVRSFRVDDTLVQRNAYETKAAVIPTVGLLMRYALDQRWFIMGGTEVRFLPNTITDSPIIDRDEAWGAFIGVARAF